MAIPEACGLWIEQRVQEELEQQKETGVSLREIGRTVAAEVEKYFETKVNPGTIFSKAQRMTSDANASKTQNPTAPSISGGASGAGNTTEKTLIKKIPETTTDPIAEIHKEVVSGASIREASRKVAEKTGDSQHALRRKYQRNTSKEGTETEPPDKKEKKKKQKQDMKEVFPLSKISKEFKEAFNKFRDELLWAKNSQWEATSFEAASHCIKSLHNIIGEQKQ